MAEFSKIAITFNVDLDIGANLKITAGFSGSETPQTWTWVATRSAAFEVTTGTPTATVGDITANNFAAAFELDFPANYIVNQALNELEIISEVEGVVFTSFKITDGSSNVLVNGVDYIVVFDNYVAPIDISNIEFALVKSPHYVNIPFNFETTTAATINLFVWDGDITTVPSSATYTLTIPRPSTNFAEFNIDLAKLIAEQLEPIPTITLTSTTQIVDSTANSVKWVKYTASYTDPIEAIADIEGTFVAIDGYGYYDEGANPTKPDDNVLTDESLSKVSRDGFVIYPFVNNGSIASIFIISETSQIFGSYTITPSNESTNVVQYVLIDVSASTTDSYVSIEERPGNIARTYEIIDECRYNPIQVVYKNRYGVYDSITLFKKSNVTLQTKSDEFVNNYIQGGTYDTTRHQYQKLNVTAKKTIKTNSGYINEAENVLYEQLLSSDTVYFYEDSKLVPVNIKTSSLEFKTRVNDKLIQYSLDFEYAYNQIQNV